MTPGVCENAVARSKPTPSHAPMKSVSKMSVGSAVVTATDSSAIATFGPGESPPHPATIAAISATAATTNQGAALPVR